MTVEPLAPPNNMTYDGENRMTAVTGGGAGSYTYDGNGQRVAKTAQGTTTVSIFSGSSVIAEYDNGASPTSPSREYVAGPSGLLAMFSGGATTYYHQDHLSVRLTTDGNGNVLSQQGSYPFGEQWYQSGPGNKWFFTSYDRDSETGLNYALARYYDSRTGTFCSADPLAGSPGDPQSWNRYPYGRNDPIDITDPSGKSWWSDLIGGALWASTLFTDGATLPLAETYSGANSAFESMEQFSRGNIFGGSMNLAGAFAAGYQGSLQDAGASGAAAPGGGAAAAPEGGAAAAPEAFGGVFGKRQDTFD